MEPGAHGERPHRKRRDGGRGYAQHRKMRKSNLNRLRRNRRRGEGLMNARLRRLVVGLAVMPVTRRDRFVFGEIRADLSGAGSRALDLRDQQNRRGEHVKSCAKHPGTNFSLASGLR
jgi:hypothetical protein